jgi:hypothetical protein
VLETNPGFIEAYLVGLNHEMARELLWRGYPTDERATFFQSFWGEDGDEIPPVHAWAPGSSLGAHLRGADAHVVVLVRGELVRRYPGISLTAVRAEWAAGGNLAAIRQAGGTVVGDRYRRPVPPERRIDADVRTAAFSGLVADDTAFAGFALRVADARGAVDARGEPDPGGAAGWFVVLRQAPAEPRFGFDEAAGEPGPIPAESARLTWAHVTRPGDGPHVVVKSPALDGRRFDGNRARWGASSAHMAYLCLQSPVLVAVHAGALLLAPS